MPGPPKVWYWCGGLSAFRPASGAYPPTRSELRLVGATPFRSLQSVCLAKVQQKDIDRLGPAMRVDITGILGNAQEIAVVEQFEPGGLDLRLDQGLRPSGAGFRRRSSPRPAWLSSRMSDWGAVHRQGGGDYREEPPRPDNHRTSAFRRAQRPVFQSMPRF